MVVKTKVVCINYETISKNSKIIFANKYIVIPLSNRINRLP